MTEFTSLLIFLVVGSLGFLFLVFSLVIGDIFEAFDLDLGFESDSGDGHFGVLDSRVLSVFLTALGGLGAIGIQFGLGFVLSVLLGLAGGVVFGGVVFAFGYLLYSQQSSSSVSERDLIGRTAKVVVGILPGSVGQISCTVGEEKVEKLARTRDGEKIEAGAIVLIEDVTGDSFIVSTMEGTGYSLFSESD
ncbi:MAG: hypothetical protein DWQ47_09195 [Acidobacteria bacterium]|nr:MAG: hypothetical protein DWQ32_17295 [Acidobacteriota bacterium]REJ98923.1 MAG: hypothetical protein DWQ38_12685 [Acidobacteriota bacterium]REK16358.1 MAG: hypothetical protein DWQ43_05005 [Acidobacteriota bacterium]REK44039.1 MAG: hypothetical protein DWQ47_09195 [Acidobacteriota bacterium]